MRENKLFNNEYIESLHTVSLMRQGQLEEARDYFASIIPLDTSHYHIQGKSEQLERYVDTDPKKIGVMNIRGQKVFLRTLLEIR